MCASATERESKLARGETCVERLEGAQEWREGVTAMLEEVKTAGEVDRIDSEKLRVHDGLGEGSVLRAKGEAH